MENTYACAGCVGAQWLCRLSSPFLHACRGARVGSSSERTRTAITAALKKKLKDIMGDFSALRQKLQLEYRSAPVGISTFYGQVRYLYMEVQVAHDVHAYIHGLTHGEDQCSATQPQLACSSALAYLS